MPKGIDLSNPLVLFSLLGAGWLALSFLTDDYESLQATKEIEARDYQTWTNKFESDIEPNVESD